MDKVKFITVHGKWIQTTPFNHAVVGDEMSRLCAVLPPMSDEEEDAAVERLLDDDNIFYVFAAEETIVGDHFDFSVTNYEAADYVSPLYH